MHRDMQSHHPQVFVWNFIFMQRFSIRYIKKKNKNNPNPNCDFLTLNWTSKYCPEMCDRVMVFKKTNKQKKQAAWINLVLAHPLLLP